MKNTIEYKCKACGAPIEFSATKEKLVCPYCSCEFDISEIESFKEELENSKADEKFYDSKEIDYSDSDLKVYHCDSCGGEVVCNENTTATECPYCSSPVILKGRLSGELKPQYIIPFKKEGKTARENFVNYVKTKRLVPNKFKGQLSITEVKGIYVPYFIYSAKVDGEVVFTGSTTNSYRSGDYEVTETKYYDLYREGSADFYNVPVDASKNINDGLMESIEPFDFSKAVEFDTPYLTGFYAEKYDVEKEECYKRAKTRMEQGTAEEFKATTTRYSGVKVKSSDLNEFNNKDAYCLYPVWLVNVKWEDKNYSFAMNGESGKLRGNFPISMPKLICGSTLLTLLFTAVITLLIMVFDNMMFDPLYLLIGLIIGALITFFIMRKEKKNVTEAVLQKGAAYYVDKNSVDIRNRKDVYLYTTTSKRKINRD